MTSALPNRVWLWGFVPWISTEYSTEYDSEHLVPTPYSVLLDLRELNCDISSTDYVQISLHLYYLYAAHIIAHPGAERLEDNFFPLRITF